MNGSYDPIDVASEREEFFRANAMRLRKPEGPMATGDCLHCGEPVRAGMRWCNADHRDAYEREKKVKR